MGSLLIKHSVPFAKSHAATTGSATTQHLRVAIGSTTSQASGVQSVVIASQNVLTTGQSSCVIASEELGTGNLNASGTRSLVAACGGCTATGTDSATIASNNVDATAGTSAIIASYGYGATQCRTVTGSRSMLAAVHAAAGTVEVTATASAIVGGYCANGTQQITGNGAVGLALYTNNANAALTHGGIAGAFLSVGADGTGDITATANLGVGMALYNDSSGAISLAGGENFLGGCYVHGGTIAVTGQMACGLACYAETGETLTLSGQQSVAMAVDGGGTLSGKNSIIAASQGGSVVSADTSAVIASYDSDCTYSSTGSCKAVIASDSCACGGADMLAQTVIGSRFSSVAQNNSTIIASRNTQAGDSHCLAGGYHATTPASANRKWELDSEDGNLRIAGALTDSHSFSDYAEYMENAVEGELLPGRMVIDDGNGLRYAQPGEIADGVVSRVSALRLGGNPFCWHKRFECDEWGTPIYHDVSVDEEYREQTGTEIRQMFGTDPKTGNPVVIGEHEVPVYETKVRKATYRDRVENPAYDPELEYKSREERPTEWTAVAMLGQVPIAIDDSVTVGTRVSSGVDGIATLGDQYKVTKILAPYDPGKGYGIAIGIVR